MDHGKAHRHLANTDPRMARLIARSRRYKIAPAVSIRPFDALAESIAYQQLSGKAAATIFGRVRALYPKRKWLDPEQLLATPDESLRAAGLSRAKTAALKDLGAKTIDGTVPSGRRRAQRLRQDLWPAKIAHPKTTGEDRRKMASLSLGCSLVFLACARSTGEVTRLKKVIRVTGSKSSCETLATVIAV